MIKAWHLYFFLGLCLSACNRCKDGCLNGVCVDNYCDCDVWYAGDQCDRSELSVYEGNYSGTFSLNASSETVSFSLVSNSEEPSKLTAEGLNLMFHFTSLTRFDVPDQSWKNQMWQGEGEMLLDLVSIRLVSTDSTGVREGLLEAYREE